MADGELPRRQRHEVHHLEAAGEGFGRSDETPEGRDPTTLARLRNCRGRGCDREEGWAGRWEGDDAATRYSGCWKDRGVSRSEEHTSELQSLRHLVCRL